MPPRRYSWSETTAHPVQEIRVVGETGSTNADLLAELRSGHPANEGCWLVADRQTAGRGRQGREWLDAAGNFAGSTCVRILPGDPPPTTLSLLASLAVYETVVEMLAEPAALRLKWPNDVMLANDKLCGILLEREDEVAVIGIGVNLAAAPKLAGRTARSLAQHGPAPARDAFARKLAGSFARELDRWRTYGAGPIITRWLAAAHPAGTPLSVHDAGGAAISGQYDGLAPDGALQLRLADGSVRVIHAGDVETGAR